MKLPSLIAPLCAAAIALGFVGQALGQSNPITAINISLPANPDANIANWGTGTSLLTITATGGPRTEGPAASTRILVIIKKGGQKVCGSHTSATAPPADFKAATTAWSGRTAASLLGKDCTLPPGDYELSVQFFSGKDSGVPSSREATKAFSIRGTEQQRTR